MDDRESSLDSGALERLREVSGGDEEFMAEIVEEYLSDAPRQLDTIDRMLTTRASEEVMRAAHTLKSTSATFGAVALEAIAREMEGLARQGRLDAIDGLSNEARAELGRVTELLRRLDLVGGER